MKTEQVKRLIQLKFESYAGEEIHSSALNNYYNLILFEKSV